MLLGLSDWLKPHWKAAAVIIKLFLKLIPNRNRALKGRKKLSKMQTF
jgi:hypothetical protein